MNTLTPTMLSLPRLVISGLSGGGGKTLLALGLARALTRHSYLVKPFKKGPDYIDAAWLTLAARCPATNLDPYFLPEAPLLALFIQAFANAHLAVIEGNRGLFDGRDVQGTCSTAALARTLAAPVIITLNCSKMTRTAAAVIAGLAAFEPVPLAGVVFNRVGTTRQSTLIRQCVETYTTIPVLGELPRLAHNPLPERHMGLDDAHCATPATEACLEYLADLVEKYTNFTELTATALAAPPLSTPLHAAPLKAVLKNRQKKHEEHEAVYESQGEGIGSQQPKQPGQAGQVNQPEQASQASQAVCTRQTISTPHRPRIGYVFDAALWFYYRENLCALSQAGANLVRVSLFDAAPWPALDGLYLGGGFPENRAASLAASPHLATIADLSQQGAPIYAECGGFMLLCHSLIYNNEEHPMAHIFPVRTLFTPRPQGLGYVQATVTSPNPFHPLGAVWRGHEFHYSRCEPLPDSPPLSTVLTLAPGTGMGCHKGHAGDGLVIRNTFAAYTHLFAPAVPHWATRFVDACHPMHHDILSKRT